MCELHYQCALRAVRNPQHEVCLLVPVNLHVTYLRLDFEESCTISCTYRHRKTAAGKMWGASLVGVGMASCTFHASSGNIRPACRKLDFWTIAAASNLLLRAVYPSCPHAVTAVGLVATPFKPFLVSFLNSTAMEMKYLYRARVNNDLKMAQVFHATTCFIGLSCFAAEEVWPRLPFMHAAWHCLSAAAVSSINHLVADVEDLELGLRAGRHSKEVKAMTLPVQQLLL